MFATRSTSSARKRCFSSSASLAVVTLSRPWASPRKCSERSAIHVTDFPSSVMVPNAVIVSPWPDPRTQPARVSTFGLGVDQHSRTEQAQRIQGCLGGLKSTGEQRRTLAIVPPSMVAPDRVMVGERASIRNQSIKSGRLDGMLLRALPMARMRNVLMLGECGLSWEFAARILRRNEGQHCDAIADGRS